jgi:GntR family transcriptional regulator
MKDFEVDNASGIPVWVQVRRRLVYCIVSGRYAIGEQLPTVRELAVELDINYNTVNKVYQDLERDGFIETKRGKGTFVAELDEAKQLQISNPVEELADELVREGLEFGMSGLEIVQAVAARVSKHKVIGGQPGEIIKVMQGRASTSKTSVIGGKTVTCQSHGTTTHETAGGATARGAKPKPQINGKSEKRVRNVG